jgi:hypothetical protein
MSISQSAVKQNTQVEASSIYDQCDTSKKGKSEIHQLRRRNAQLEDGLHSAL